MFKTLATAAVVVTLAGAAAQAATVSQPLPAFDALAQQLQLEAPAMRSLPVPAGQLDVAPLQTSAYTRTREDMHWNWDDIDWGDWFDRDRLCSWKPWLPHCDDDAGTPPGSGHPPETGNPAPVPLPPAGLALVAALAGLAGYRRLTRRDDA